MMPTKSLSRHQLLFAAALTLVLFVLQVSDYVVRRRIDTFSVFPDGLSLVLFAIVIFLAIRRAPDFEPEGNISFRAASRTGFLVSLYAALVFSILMVLFWGLVLSGNDPLMIAIVSFLGILAFGTLCTLGSAFVLGTRSAKFR